MGERKIKVPEGMLKASYDWEWTDECMNVDIETILESALRWLSDLSKEEFKAFVKELRK